jgi:hypothetical protein
MLDHSCQVQRHPLAERGLDLYETPPVAVDALLRYEKLPHQIWEPAAGRGAIVRVLRDAGHAVNRWFRSPNIIPFKKYKVSDDRRRWW